ncbi:rRNA maturation RNase YbeY [Lewinella sp. IMCC34191]|uniref:rRNA maturation RNase YbeY n=1 Tax=Lewinella sp. IMCC34191 TaxID=2259172 RepID=UPI001E605232|nr:rRNA maturation RNase YbeY [Lewinella sp. IMCC34191]
MTPSFSLHEAGGTLPEQEESLLEDWIRAVIEARGGRLGELTYIFCDDDYLHQVNVEYLQHDTLTDIITFPYAEFPLVSGDLFISTERVADNAKEYGESYTTELHRVMVHGVLHLCGQSDKSSEDAGTMRDLEAWALSLRPAALAA